MLGHCRGPFGSLPSTQMNVEGILVPPQGVCETCGYMTNWLQQKEAASTAGVTTHTIRAWIKDNCLHVWVLPRGKRSLICEQSLIGHGRGRLAPTMAMSNVVRSKKPKNNAKPESRGKSVRLGK